MKKWTIEDSKEIYNIKGWGVNFFGVNEKGHVYVTPKKNNVQVDLKEVVDELAAAHISAPLLLRFPDIPIFPHLCCCVSLTFLIPAFSQRLHVLRRPPRSITSRVITISCSLSR